MRTRAALARKNLAARAGDGNLAALSVSLARVSLAVLLRRREVPRGSERPTQDIVPGGHVRGGPQQNPGEERDVVVVGAGDVVGRLLALHEDVEHPVYGRRRRAPLGAVRPARRLGDADAGVRPRRRRALAQPHATTPPLRPSRRFFREIGSIQRQIQRRAERRVHVHHRHRLERLLPDVRARRRRVVLVLPAPDGGGLPRRSTRGPDPLP
mmetsp:Transcript_14950/g.63007  ORF Transcript_14950/g.63007 Transcript_14950/m.63007 type:complete len:211 (-) Transcript_14950:374-1006(-)